MDNRLCTICWEPKEEHTSSSMHDYVPEEIRTTQDYMKLVEAPIKKEKPNA